MVSDPADITPALGRIGWFGPLWRRRHPTSRLPAMADLADPPETIDEAAAKAALDQVLKRQDGQLAVKTSTENRALTLAGQCMTALVAVTGAGFIEAAGSARIPLLAAACAGGLCLFLAVWSALSVIKPRNDLILPGRLPDELWDELLLPGMKGPEFIARYIKSLQDGMVRHEEAQRARAAGLRRTVFAALLAVPMAVFAGALSWVLQWSGIL